ncbi:glycosyltransferase family 2 protein [Subtercola boreus]|uniref:Glycosyltransferase 2-like domain-containing protein n=1 Tax=Subtercola boreus TaxID=120213 RepID=A0A3E0WCV0_9MICO|nr:glycosyltransferase family 2 protein [Subtercola boreus]RFA22641.1 hypothetical protein B7R24_03225 [Subtercola boreus]RFA22997.1 hypothetical protein B7R23_03220 [Subtercola boreus]RFA28748.1 hypothetical protein B7R25_03235 [Subtercola boreus]
MTRIDFEAVDQPTCSIVILAWRLTDILLDCLASIRASEGAPSYEVVIVLNGADPAVRDTVAREVSGAVIVDLPHNVGFGGGCNAGAADARGESLVFLNDDTVVDPHWLARLHGAAGEAPRAVASLLLNVDGTVQEAGSRVLSDAVTVQLGRDLPLVEARDTGLLEQRSVDYGSAAALLVPADAFRAAAGFDPAFEPAYFEDVDLQFRLRAAGLDVVFEPAARVTHLSGASTSASHAFRDWAYAHALPVFVSRWSTVLANAPAEDAPLEALCPIPLDAALANGGRTLPTAEQIRSGAADTALAIARGFGLDTGLRYDTLIADYQRVEALYLATEARYGEQVAELSRHLTAHVNRVAQLESELGSLQGETGRLNARLHDLDSRGPVGLARWQAGKILAKRGHGQA